MQAGRVVVLAPRSRLPALPGRPRPLTEGPITRHIFYVQPRFEDAVMRGIVASAGLDTPGRGTVYSESVRVYRAEPVGALDERELGGIADGRSLPSDYIGITCIVQRGQATVIARLALELGLGVPVVTFGQGTGLRDKLGLLRITIPAEKEIVNLVVPGHDADGVLNILIDAAKLNQPGKGFIYTSRVPQGLVNTMTEPGGQTQAATIPHIIAAIDELQGGTRWRRRFTADEVSSVLDRRECLSGLVNLTMICNEGRMLELTRAAMAAGAGGATTAQLRHLGAHARAQSAVSAAREKADMVVSPHRVDAIVAALEKAGLCDEGTCGQVDAAECPRALTYVRRLDPLRTGNGQAAGAG